MWSLKTNTLKAVEQSEEMTVKAAELPEHSLEEAAAAETLQQCASREDDDI